MTTYYISTEGSDSNNGLGPDASDATNKPWLTVGKALGASGISSGDTVYIGPGVYREEVSVAMTAPTGETFVIGDPGNAQGFKDSSGNLLSAGDVRLTAYTTDDNTSPPGSSQTIDLNAVPFLTFQYLHIVGGSAGNGSAIDSSATKEIKFHDCVFSASADGVLIRLFLLADTASGCELKRCTIINSGSATRSALFVLPEESGTADYDIDFLVENCVVLTPGVCIRLLSTGSGGNFGNGITVRNCFMLGAKGVYIQDGGSTNPSTVVNSIICATTGLHAGSSGDLTSNYNAIYAQTNYSNVTGGANDTTGSKSLLLEFGQAQMGGRYLRPFLTPTADSTLMGIGGTSPPGDDLLGRIRPAGGESTSEAIGPLERHDTAQVETTTTDSGNGIVLIGPADQELQIPVDAESTTISVKVRYDTTHGTGNPPQAELLAAPELGISIGQIVVAGGTADTWETLTFASVTPNAKGVLRLRLVSRSAAGGGKAFFDTIGIT